MLKNLNEINIDKVQAILLYTVMMKKFQRKRKEMATKKVISIHSLCCKIQLSSFIFSIFAFDKNILSKRIKRNVGTF